MMETQTVVIGAGVIGLAVARALAIGGREVIVLERAGHIGAETSSRNSEVIHSGLYYPRCSLKARLCVEGRKLLYTYCERHHIPCRRTGKLIVATVPAEIAVLERYFNLASQNNVGLVEWMSPLEVERIEPALRCVRALHVPCTGIVDSHALLNALLADLQASGGIVALHSDVIGGRRDAGGRFELDVAELNETLQCRELVNCAGLYAPNLARQLIGCAGEHAPQARYARGHYFTLSGRAPFSRLIYPVADAAGLGIHVTVDMAGRIKFGPDVEWIDQPSYLFDATRREDFVKAIQRYYPALDESRLQPDYVGIRPKISAPGATPADFRIDGPAQHGVAGLVHLYGIESPGLTATLAIASNVVARLTTATKASER